MEALRKEIEQVLGPVGFNSYEPPDNLDVPPPDGAALWMSSYAIVTLCPVPHSDADGRTAFVDKCETWLEALATSLENEKRGFLDAYLLLGLQEKPDETMLAWARASAVSTRFSRKQVVWPYSSTDAQRSSRVCTISVAEIPVYFAAAKTTDFDADAAADIQGPFPEWVMKILETDEKDVPELARQFLEKVE